ncbi:MAG: diguanylate cyclase [Paraglaciecola sp.]|nr:diguanylate cyclase [Paraglaciecola sp.]
MPILPTKVLLVEDDQAMLTSIHTALDCYQSPLFDLRWSKDVDGAESHLLNGNIDIILLDIRKMNGTGLANFEHLYQQAPHAIFILICEQTDEGTARQAVSLGASDFINKHEIDQGWLRRVLRYNLASKKTKNVLNISIAGFKAIGEASPLGIMVSDMTGNITYTNEAYHRITGHNAKQLLGKHWAESVFPDDLIRVQREWRQAVQSQQPFQSQLNLRHFDNSKRGVYMHGAFLRDNKKLYGHVRLFENIAAREGQYLRADCTFRGETYSSNLPSSALNYIMANMQDAVLMTDQDSKVTYLNACAEQLTGWSNLQAKGLDLNDIFKVSDNGSGQRVDNPAKLAMEINQTIHLATDCVLSSQKDGSTAIHSVAVPMLNNAGNMAGAVLMFSDKEPDRQLSNAKLHAAQHDVLTALPNRYLLEDRLGQALLMAKRRTEQLAVMHIDIDGFEQILTVHGKTKGELLLKSLAQRLQAITRESDTLCHVEINEFVLLLANVKATSHLQAVYKKLVRRLSQAYLIEKQTINVALSIGISVFPEDGNLGTELLDKAVQAMQHVKNRGRSHSPFYQETVC